MIRIAALAAAAVLAALPARADDWAECNNIFETARAMAACSRMIDGGTHDGPHLAMIHATRAGVHDHAGQRQSAIDDLDRAIRLDPTAAHYFSNRANVLNKMGRYADAAQSADHSIAMDGSNPMTFLIRGLSLAALGRTDEARNDWDVSVRMGGPDLVHAMQDWLAHLGHYDGPLDGRDRPAFRTGLMACATDPNC